MRKLAWLVPLCGFILCGLVQGFGTGSPPRLDRAWKKYRNAQWSYCVSYPSRWVKGDAFEGAGLFVETGTKKFSKPLGEIDIAALAPEQAVRAEVINLKQDVEAHFDGLKRFERAEQVEMLEQHELRFQGYAAVFAKDRYYDPQERATWLEELVLVNRKDSLFRLELECRADQATRFEPVFSRVMDTFRFDCAAEQ